MRSDAFLCFYYLHGMELGLLLLLLLLQTCNLDSNLIMQQYKIDLMARFEEINSMNPRLRQDQTMKELNSSSSSLKL